MKISDSLNKPFAPPSVHHKMECVHAMDGERRVSGVLRGSRGNKRMIFFRQFACR